MKNWQTSLCFSTYHRWRWFHNHWQDTRLLWRALCWFKYYLSSGGGGASSIYKTGTESYHLPYSETCRLRNNFQFPSIFQSSAIFYWSRIGKSFERKTMFESFELLSSSMIIEQCHLSSRRYLLPFEFVHTIFIPDHNEYSTIQRIPVKPRHDEFKIPDFFTLICLRNHITKLWNNESSLEWYRFIGVRPFICLT